MAFLRPKNNIKGANKKNMMDLKTYGYTEIDTFRDGLLPSKVTEIRRERPREWWEFYVAQQNENKYVHDKTSYLIEKKVRNKTTARQSKQTKKKGDWKK
ncbi:hypothetical protein ACFYKT_06675 [Cytobacillus sp. FJAT-53684]|uniref:Uncharacterized protein n=1 Tax=Cytobacillus mangrovibacter TaxID=3299024 RepID=A0ABW6JZ60_9BACI